MAKKKKVVEKEESVIRVEQNPIGKVVTDAYLDFSKYINCRRHLAELDGLKISYRRLIYTLLTQFSHSTFHHTNTAIAAVASIHPHALASFNNMSAVLVKSGIFEGEGSFGYTSIDGVINEPAADRYTYIKISDLFWDIMGDLIKEVPYQESPNNTPEPCWLPAPLPLGIAAMKSLNSGLGVGISMIYPNFSAWSMYQAYLNDNPQLLEPGVDLILDKKNSELDKLWNTGKGRVVYAYKISRYKNPETGLEGILFETKDGTEIFTPKLKALRKLEEENKIFIEDITDSESCKMVVYRIPGARGITIDDVEGLCRRCCFSSQVYNLNITDGQTAFRIPLKAWIDFTYKRYIDLITSVNKKKMERVKFDISVLEAIPVISDYIINKNPKAGDEEIIRVLGFSKDIVETVMSKPISYLRKNSDNTGRIKSLKEKLKELKKFNPIQYTEEIIKKI